MWGTLWCGGNITYADYLVIDIPGKVGGKGTTVLMKALPKAEGVWSVCVFHLVSLFHHLVQLDRDGSDAVAIHLTVLLKSGALQLQFLLFLQVLCAHTHTHIHKHIFITKAVSESR